MEGTSLKTSSTPCGLLQEDNSEATTFKICSGRACKASLPSSYPFKMCEACRGRHRIYSGIKRAKRRMERNAFKEELAERRKNEDARRAKEGLLPLSASPEDLSKWELSIVDEECTIPASVLDALSNSVHGGTSFGGLGGASRFFEGKKLGTTEPASAAGTSGQGGAGGEPVTENPAGPILSPSSAHINSPSNSDLSNKTNETHQTHQPSQNNNTTISVEIAHRDFDPSPVEPRVALFFPLQGRMCSVDQCTTKLDGAYRYKRCEQHRLQNRYQLKMMRAKGTKVQDGLRAGITANSTAMGGTVNSINEQKGTQKAVERGGQGDGCFGGEGNIGTSADGGCNLPSKAGKVKEKRRTTTCMSRECCNLLSVGAWWRNCDDCRQEKNERRKAIAGRVAAVKRDKEALTLITGCRDGSGGAGTTSSQGDCVGGSGGPAAVHMVRVPVEATDVDEPRMEIDPHSGNEGCGDEDDDDQTMNANDDSLATSSSIATNNPDDSESTITPSLASAASVTAASFPDVESTDHHCLTPMTSTTTTPFFRKTMTSPCISHQPVTVRSAMGTLVTPGQRLSSAAVFQDELETPALPSAQEAITSTLTSETTIFQSIPVPAAQSSAPSSKEMKPIKWRPYNQTVQLQDLTPQINYGSPIRFAKAKNGQNLGGGEGVSQENPPALGSAAPQHICNALETVQPKAKKSKRTVNTPTQSAAQKESQAQTQMPIPRLRAPRKRRSKSTVVPQPCPPMEPHSQSSHAGYGLPNVPSSSTHPLQCSSTSSMMIMPQPASFQHPFPYPPPMYTYSNSYPPPPGYPFTPQGFIQVVYGQPSVLGQQENTLQTPKLQPGTYPTPYRYGKDMNHSYSHAPLEVLDALVAKKRKRDEQANTQATSQVEIHTGAAVSCSGRFSGSVLSDAGPMAHAQGLASSLAACHSNSRAASTDAVKEQASNAGLSS